MTPARSWAFLSFDQVLRIHDRVVTETGGSPGLRDESLLRSALGRLEHRCDYGDPDVVELAALCLLGIIQNHAFVDGNKRTAVATAELFLIINGYEFTVSNADLVDKAVQIVAEKLTEQQVDDWIREHLRPKGRQ